MPNQVFNAGLKTGDVRKAGPRREDGDKKNEKKGNGNGDPKKRKRTEGGRKKTRSDTQH